MTIKPRKAIEKLKEYIPGEQPQEKGFIKLNTNENPYPPPPSVLKAIHKFDPEKSRLYPDPMSTALRKFLAKKYNLDINQIIIGNGSDELLRMLTECFLDKNEKLAILYPTYTLYATLCQMREAKLVTYEATNKEFPIEIANSNPRMIMIANPNPPFGSYYSNEVIAKVCTKAKKSLIVVDEAYIDFAPSNSIPLLKEFNNLVITRSLSKSFSMAGIRIGIAMGNSEIIRNLFKVKDSYNINAVSQAAALAAFQDEEYCNNKNSTVIREREKLEQEFKTMGFDVPHSQGNFVFLLGHNPKKIYEKLKERKILIRYLTFQNLLSGIRITIGTPLQNKILIKEMKSILAKEK